jgi:hypothetical protein
MYYLAIFFLDWIGPFWEWDWVMRMRMRTRKGCMHEDGEWYLWLVGVDTGREKRGRGVVGE